VTTLRFLNHPAEEWVIMKEMPVPSVKLTPQGTKKCSSKEEENRLQQNSHKSLREARQSYSGCQTPCAYRSEAHRHFKGLQGRLDVS
jgi:hypothetical protein